MLFSSRLSDFSVLADSQQSKSSGPNTGLIVGVSLGAILLVLLLGVILGLTVGRQRKRSVTIGGGVGGK